MSTAGAIVTAAHRQSNLIALDDTPTAGQMAEGLDHLSRVVQSTFGFEVGRLLKTVRMPDDEPNQQKKETLASNVRLMFHGPGGSTFKFPEYPDSGDRIAVIDVSRGFMAAPITLDANGYLIDDGSSVAASPIVLNVSGTNREWMFDAAQGAWIIVPETFQSADSFPFPVSCDFYFIGLVAAAINPAYGVEMNVQSQLIFARAKMQLEARYSWNQKPWKAEKKEVQRRVDEPDPSVFNRHSMI